MADVVFTLRASGKRLALAGCLDYLIFGAPWAVAMWALSRALPGFEGESWIVKIGFFTVLELLFFRVFKWSPGQYLVGIFEESRGRFDSPAGLDARPSYLVDASLVAAERWWTILIGVVIVLDGAKAMVRWTEFTPPAPWFGWVPEPPLAAVLFVAFGLAEFAVGAGVLRLSRPLIRLGFLLYSVQLVSNALSWQRWPEWIAAYVSARRVAQGVPIRDGEIEVAQAFMPFLLVTAPALGLAAVVAAYWQARKKASTRQAY